VGSPDNSGVLRHKIVAAPLSALIWASYVVIVIAWTPLVFLYRLATLRSDPDRYRLGRFFRNSAVLAGNINPFWKFRIVDDVHPDPRRPYVFVSNHSSNADAFTIVRLPWEMKLLFKKSLLRIPLLGWQLLMAGDVPVIRGNKESARQAMEELKRWLRRRVSVFFFPEGTRSRDGALGPFREGAFRLAIEAGVDVVPLAITGAGQGLPKHSFVFQPTMATLTVLPPVSTKGLSAADAPRLAAEVREVIARSLAASVDPI
jgi:1-acyl-sn-glycerol-3-phosphate acyltransferase